MKIRNLNKNLIKFFANNCKIINSNKITFKALNKCKISFKTYKNLAKKSIINNKQILQDY